MEQSSVANWQIGRLELFFEGSWGQVCAGSFGAADANVACRSMGFGSGTVGPLDINFNNPTRERLVYPEIAVTSLGCTGQEENLLQCPGEMDIRGADYYPYDSDGCFDDIGRPLEVACVTAAESGACRLPYSSQKGLCRFVCDSFHHLLIEFTQHALNHCMRMPLNALHDHISVCLQLVTRVPMDPAIWVCLRGAVSHDFLSHGAVLR